MDLKLCNELEKINEQFNTCKNPYYVGCYKKCPCQLINNCSYYINDNHKNKRLKNKEYNHSDYYDIYFRSEAKLSEVIFNG